MKYVVIVNGKPESGKTTFQQFCKDYINLNEYGYTHIVSSIDPIKEIYRKLGWDGKKTDKARKDLSILKKIWIETCEGPLKYMVDYIIKLDDDCDHFIFIDVREESEIIKLKEILETLYVMDIRCMTVLITRHQVDGFEYGNKSDDNVGQNKSLYQYKVYNGGNNLDEFRSYADIFVEDLLNI